MNINFQPISFKAAYKQVKEKHMSRNSSVNSSLIAQKMEQAKTLALKAQEYMDEFVTREKISSINDIYTIEFHNPILDGVIDLKNMEPYMCQTVPSVRGKETIDWFLFGLDENGNLNIDSANSWLEYKQDNWQNYK